MSGKFPVDEGGADLEILGEDYGALIMVEANLEVPPTFQLRRTDSSRRVSEFYNTLVNEEGERVQQHWRISVPEPYDLPGPFDQDVWMAVQTLVGMRGGMPPDGRLYFSLYELLGVMRKARKGDNYRELRASLLRLSATHFQADNAFYLKDKNKLATRTFTLWDVSLDFEVDHDTGQATERHFLDFHNVVRQSFQAEYLKTLDSDFYFSLRSPLAKRLYRLIDRKRQGNPRWGTSLERLRDMAPLAPSYKTPSKIRDVLRTANGELQRRGFLSGVSFEKRNGSHWVRWRIDPAFDRRRSKEVHEGSVCFDSKLSEADSQAISLLIDCGVWANVARDLVHRHGPESCCLQVESLGFQKGVSNPPAWLHWAIETSHPLPNPLRAQPSLISEEESVSNYFDFSGGTEDLKPRLLPDPYAAPVWDRVLDIIEETLHSPSAKMWFDGAVPTGMSGEPGKRTLTIDVPNAVAQEYIAERFKESLESALARVLGEHVTLEVVTKSHQSSQSIASE